MDEQRISVETRAVEITLANGEDISGQLFLQLHGTYLYGPQTVEEVLNSEEMFVPFQHDGHVELINLEQIVSVACEAGPEFDELLLLGEEHKIALETTNGLLRDITVFVNLPTGNNRIKDFLNQRKNFLLFVKDEQVVYLRRDKIIRVKDDVS